MNVQTTASVKPKKRRKSKSSEVWRQLRKNKTAIMGMLLLGAILFAVIFAGLFASEEAVTKQNYAQVLRKPSAEFPFGTDNLGRDQLARVLYGGRNSLTLGIVSMLISLGIGCVIGSMCGYFAGIFDQIVMRLLDTVKAIPNTMMALAIVAAMGASLQNLMLAISIAQTPSFVRVVRSAVIGISNNEYLEAAKACGTSTARIIYKHIIPNVVGIIIVQASMVIAQMILQAASLSFIGMGIQPPAAEWGAMLSSSREYLRNAPYLMLFPGLFLVLTAYSFNLIGDGLRDAFDPKLRT
jgi:peptide/nickel transport system permease protein